MMRIMNPYYSLNEFTFFCIPALVYSLVANVVVRIGTNVGIIPTDMEQQLPAPPSSTIGSNDMAKKYAIITGSNTGIGYETAKALVIDYGYNVIVACRSREKGIQAVTAINNEATKKQTSTSSSTAVGKALFLHPLDLSSFESIRSFCAAMKTEFSSKLIHVLINNAGTSLGNEISQNNFDLAFQSNFLGHYLLTILLLNTKCIHPTQGRIVNLGSVMHHFSRVPTATKMTTIRKDSNYFNNIEFWKTITEPKGPMATSSYCFSKLASILFTVEMNRRFRTKENKNDNTNGSRVGRIRSITVNPGAV